MDQPTIPDLASILQTLKAYAPPAPQPTLPSDPPSDLEDGEYDPSQYNPIQTTLPQQPRPAPPTPSPTTLLTNPKPSPPSSTHPKPPPPVPSASHIKTYPQALTHTINHIFPHPPFKRRITHLIATQHAHERSWWTAREDLIRKAKGRDTARRALEGVLASVGGAPARLQKETPEGGDGDGEGEGEVERELAVFDKKVYRAWREMRDAAGRELGEMGVPFFCYKGAVGEMGGGVGMEEGELEGLRVRIVVLLEDYCGGGDGDGEMRLR